MLCKSDRINSVNVISELILTWHRKTIQQWCIHYSVRATSLFRDFIQLGINQFKKQFYEPALRGDTSDGDPLTGPGDQLLCSINYRAVSSSLACQSIPLHLGPGSRNVVRSIAYLNDMFFHPDRCVGIKIHKY